MIEQRTFKRDLQGIGAEPGELQVPARLQGMGAVQILVRLIEVGTLRHGNSLYLAAVFITKQAVTGSLKKVVYIK